MIISLRNHVTGDEAVTATEKTAFAIGSGRDCPVARILLNVIMLNSLILSYPTASKGFNRISTSAVISLLFCILLNM